MAAPAAQDFTTHSIFFASAARQAWVLIAACAAVWWSYGLWDLWGPDESRYVQIARELLGRGNWFLLTVYGDPYNQKPPLPFWLFAMMLRLGHGEVQAWLVRLPPLLCAVGGVLATWAIARRWWGPRAGLIAGFILLSMPEYMNNAQPAELDMLLCGGVTAALAGWLLRAPSTDPRRSTPIEWGLALLLWGGAVFAFFVKGPPALLFIFALLAGACVGRRSVQPLWAARIVIGIPLLAILIYGWLYLQRQIYGAEFVDAQLRTATVDRWANADHAEPFYYYFPRLFTSIGGPWMLVAAWGVARFWRGRKVLRGQPGAEPLPDLAGMLLISLVVLTAFSAKRQAYILPLLPACALFAAWQVEAWCVRAVRTNCLGGFIAALAGVAALACLALAFAPVIFRNKYPGVYEPPLWQLPVGLLLAAGGFWTLRRAWRMWDQPAWLAVCLALVLLLLGNIQFGLVNPAVNAHKSSRVFAGELEAFLKSHGEVKIGGAEKAGRPMYHVYGHYGVHDIQDEEQTFARLETMPRYWLVRGDETHKKKKSAAQEPVLTNLEEKLVQHGFVHERDFDASDDVLRLYRRP